jgi:predicted nucleotidyltransferase
MPTALELGPEGWSHYISNFRQRSDHSHIPESVKDDREKLMIRIRELATAIKKRFGARRVILFGSLAHEEWFRTDSDVDLAVEGLSGEDYWKAWGLAEEIITDRPIDLVEVEAASDSMKKAIERYGVEI